MRAALARAQGRDRALLFAALQEEAYRKHGVWPRRIGARRRPSQRPRQRERGFSQEGASNEGEEEQGAGAKAADDEVDAAQQRRAQDGAAVGARENADAAGRRRAGAAGAQAEPADLSDRSRQPCSAGLARVL
jgi:hypothetical protein